MEQGAVVALNLGDHVLALAFGFMLAIFTAEALGARRVAHVATVLLLALLGSTLLCTYHLGPFVIEVAAEDKGVLTFLLCLFAGAPSFVVAVYAGGQGRQSQPTRGSGEEDEAP